MNDSEYAWIEAHIADNPDALRLACHGRTDGFDYSNAITQIECRRKFGAKLQQTLASFGMFEFPTVLAGEQATSDLLAAYHSSLIPEDTSVVDLTAGLGIDVFHIASHASSVVAVEMANDRAEALRYNAAGLHLDNVEVIEGDCALFIDSCIAQGRRFETAFIDPARRSSDGGRVFALSDCEPDVTAILPKLRQICRRLLIKASPMLDIAHTVKLLEVTPVSVAALGTTTECKELFITIDFEAEVTEPVIEGVTLLPDGGAVKFSFTRTREDSAAMPRLTAPLKEGDFIFEAYPAVMKTGVFKLLADSYGLSVFHPNTRLFYSTEAVKGFPGKCYRVIETLPYASKVIKRFKSRYPRIEVAVRNFGLSADALRGKLGVRDGGTLRLYGYTDSRSEQMLAVVESVQPM